MNIGIVWVKTYKSRQANLKLSKACATGFAEAIKRAIPNSTVVEHSEAAAFDALFQRPAAVNHQDMVYYSGHGSDDGPIFEVITRDDGLAKFSDVELGGRALKVVVFDCCRALKPGGLWRRGFQGLRWLLGFTDDVFQSAHRGRIFGQFLLDRLAKPVDEAWSRAAIETDEAGIPWAVVRALDREGEIPDDVLPRLPHPTPPRFFVFAAELPDSPVPAAEGEEVRDRVRLFSVQPPGWVGESLAGVCRRLGVAEHPQEDTEDFHRFGGGALDVFRASDSVWWSKARQRRDLFGESPDLPAPDQAIAQALSFLREKQSLPAEIRKTWTTVTREMHEEPARRNRELVTARHVHVTYRLDGLPVMGPGAKTRVTFQSREVDAFHQLWQHPSATTVDVNIIDADEAEKRLRKDEAFVEVSDHLSIESRRLGYYAPPAREWADYLLPVWAIRGKVTTEATEYGFVRYVPAAESIPANVRTDGSVFNLPRVFP